MVDLERQILVFLHIPNLLRRLIPAETYSKLFMVITGMTPNCWDNPI
jgi:hypothetical protein